MLVSNSNQNIELAGRNIRKLKILSPETLNIFDLLNCEWLVLSKETLPTLSEVLLK